MEENEIKNKTIGLPETIFIGLLVGIEELAEAVILIVTLGLGIIVVEVMNGAMFLIIEMYMLLRGGRGIMKLIVEPIGAAINGFSGGILPGKTVAALTGIWVINNPEKIDKITGGMTKFIGQIGTTVATAAGGAVGGAAAKVASSKIVGTITEKAVGGAVEQGAVAARQRITMATRASSASAVGAERMIQARAQAQQAAQQPVPEGESLQKAA